MKFLVDMPLSPSLTHWLVQQGHDAVHASQVGLSCAPDAKVLEYARDEQRVVITADLDYPRLLALAQEEGPGLILFRGGNYSEQEVVEGFRQVFKTVKSEELPTSIIVIEKERIRRRHLPI